MKWIIASDLHGSAHYCRQLLEAWKREEAPRMLFLGDLLYHGPRNDLPEGYAPKEVIALLQERQADIFCVRGNCEAEVDQMVLPFPVLADYCLLESAGHLIYATHGHHFNEDHLPPLHPGDVLLHGHTHIPRRTLRDGVYVLNPGSISIPKAGSWHGYMTLEDGVFTLEDALRRRARHAAALRGLTMEFTAAQDGLRVDVFLAGCLPELTRSAVQRLLAEGSVTCGGAPVRKNARTEAGAVYAVTLPEARPVETAAQDIPLDIVYEDGDVLVINKPKGLVVHPAAGHEDGTLVNALLYHCGDSLSGVGGERRPGIVHRIDRDTTGLLIVAKNDFAHRHLAAQLSDHTLRRTYECIVRGGFREDSGTVNAPIGRDPRDRKRMAVTEKNSREAVTHWEVIARYGQYTHLRCRLETGRTHQIRVHMAWIRHPIAGDPVYGIGKPELGLHSQCLHAKELHVSCTPAPARR